MDNPGDYLVYQHVYSNPAKDTNNGLLYRVVHVEACTCPACEEEATLTHGIAEEGSFIHAYECSECDYDVVAFTGDCGICAEGLND